MKTVAQIGSVIGRNFAVRLLARVVGEEQAALEGPLTALQQAEIAFPSQYFSGALATEPEYIFKHVTMREAAYNMLVRKRRKELHFQTARAIAALYPSDEYVEMIAYHYSKTDADAEAAGWIERAGDRAAAMYSNDSSVTHYEEALRRLVADEDSRAARARVFGEARLGAVASGQTRYGHRGFERRDRDLWTDRGSGGRRSRHGRSCHCLSLEWLLRRGSRSVPDYGESPRAGGRLFCSRRAASGYCSLAGWARQGCRAERSRGRGETSRGGLGTSDSVARLKLEGDSPSSSTGGLRRHVRFLNLRSHS